MNRRWRLIPSMVCIEQSGLKVVARRGWWGRPAEFLSLGLWFGLLSSAVAAQQKCELPYFGIRIVDDQTGNPVPLVALKTVNEVTSYTDSDGWASFFEPEMMNREVFFSIASAGYEFPADGFGNRGVRLQTTPGETALVKVKRTQIAERIVRLTGQGVRGHSEKLRLNQQAEKWQANSLTLGQDSVQAVPFGDGIFWLWGDTNLAFYPLGNFHTTAARSVVPTVDNHGAVQGFSFQYFLDDTSTRVRRMCPDAGPGAVWLWGLLNVDDEQGNETLVAHYSRNLSLGNVAEQGLVQFDGTTGTFKKIRQFDLAESWRFPRGNAVAVTDNGRVYFYFAEPFFHTRVPADYRSVVDPASYEALTYNPATAKYEWQRTNPPTTQDGETKLLASGQMPAAAARYQTQDSSGTTVKMHRGSICFCRRFDKWLMVATEAGTEKSESPLGEIWLALAGGSTGPWSQSIKIATHGGYTLYNPRIHPFLESADGRFIFFEGTFTLMFSRNSFAVPQYDYNQLLYRVDLQSTSLESVLGK